MMVPITSQETEVQRAKNVVEVTQVVNGELGCGPSPLTHRGTRLSLVYSVSVLVPHIYVSSSCKTPLLNVHYLCCAIITSTHKNCYL